MRLATARSSTSPNTVYTSSNANQSLSSTSRPTLQVALSNGNAAVIRELDEERGFVVLDANHPFAGSDLQLAVKLMGIEDNPDTGSGPGAGPGVAEA